MPCVASAADGCKAFLGSWALTLPDNRAGWLGVVEKDGHLEASLLWSGGSVLPLDQAKVEGDQLILSRTKSLPRAKPVKGKPANITIVETITAKASGDDLQLTRWETREGKESPKADLTGKRTPDPGPAPDLSKVKFGAPIELLNGRDLTGWRLIGDNPSAWSVQDGVLMNRPVQEEGKPHKRFANIRTEQEFEDFRLTLEVRTLEKSNSGVYLRGIYEVQIAESFGKPLDPHNMGAIYSRICPTEAAEKPIGEWQTLDITLVDRHATVILNGKKIIDNQPILGCTGGALWSDPFRPGPIFLQGDHSAIDYRNMKLMPVVK
jgi:hypothetical protein